MARDPSNTVSSSAFWATAALLCACILLLGTRLLNHDVAQHMYAGAAMFRGLTLYREFVEMNPPLIYAVLGLPQLFADASGLDPYVVLVGFVLLVTLCSARLCVVALDADPRVAPHRDHGWRAFVVLLALLLPAIPHFGQREHLMVSAVFPYLMLSSPAHGLAVPRRAAIAIGALAGLGMALKPHFILLFVALEWNRITCGARFSLHRPHVLGALAVVAAYWAMVGAFFPAYFTEMLPLALREYTLRDIDASSFRAPLLLVDRSFVWSLVALALGAGAIAPRRADAWRATWSTGIAAFLLVAWLQRKGHDYHALPAMTAALWLLASLSRGLFRSSGPPLDAGQPCSALVRIGARPTFVALLVTIWLLAGVTQALGSALVPRRHEGTVRRLARQVALYGRARPILVLSVHIFPAFPLVNITQSRWAMRYPSLWLLVNRIDRRSAPGVRQVVPDELPEAIADDVLRSQPCLAIVDDNTWGKRRWPILAYLSRSPRFAQLWRAYREIARIDGYRVLSRCAAPEHAEHGLSAATVCGNRFMFFPVAFSALGQSWACARGLVGHGAT